MATLFYIVLILFAPGVHFTLFWFLISLLFSLAFDGTRVIYRYTNDHTLAGHQEEV